MLLPEDEVNCQDEACEACEVVPLEGVALDEEYGKESEDHQRDNLLNNLKLPYVEGTTIHGAT